MFVKILTIEPIKDWRSIDDDRSFELLNEVLNSLGDDAVLQRNFEALEKRYSKPTGTISEWIFNKEISDPIQILNLLKKTHLLLYK